MTRRIHRLVLGASLFLNIVVFILLFILADAQARNDHAIVQEITPQASPTNSGAPTNTATTITMATPTAASKPTMTATTPPSPTPEATTTFEPTAAPTATPTPTPTPPPTTTPTPTPKAAEWLNYLNQFRQTADLPLLTEDRQLSAGSRLHSEYMVINDNPFARSEDPTDPLYSEAGHRAALNGDIYATSQRQGDFDWAINFWMSAPFHAVPILDPQLQNVGYGDFHDNEGEVQMAAVLDVKSGIGSQPPTAAYPIFFPKDGGETWVVRRSMIEYPDPLGNCPGYETPTGPPIILQIGSGAVTPQVTGHSFEQDGAVVASCLYDETTYVNENVHTQAYGRAILDERDAIVLIPRAPLEAGSRYTASIVVNGETYSWSFTAVARPGATANGPINVERLLASLLILEPDLTLADLTNLMPTTDRQPFTVRTFEWGGQTHDFNNSALMRNMEMRWVKIQQKWRPTSVPEELAGRIQRAQAAGFKVLLSLPGDPYPRDINYEAYIEFLQRVASLGTPPDAIEVWNEMNIGFEWPTGNIDPAGYVNSMLAPAYEAIKGANPNIIVISGAPAPTGFNDTFNAWSDQRYLAGMVEAGAVDYLDCIGMHYNAGATSPHATSGHPAGDHYGWYFQPSLAMYYESFGKARPVCITEIGYLSGDGYPTLPEQFWWARNTSATEQAQWLAEALAMARASRVVRLAIIFSVDIVNWDWEDDPQAGYAIIRPDGSCPFCSQ